jgi:hypothetical protein
VSNQNMVTRVTSTRISCIANMGDLSCEMPIVLLGLNRGLVTGCQDGNVLEQTAVGASGFGMMFFVFLLFAADAAALSKGKERVQL